MTMLNPKDFDDHPVAPQPEIDASSSSDVRDASASEGATARAEKRSSWLPTLIGLVLLVIIGVVLNAAVRARTESVTGAAGGNSASARPLPVQVAELIPVDRLSVERSFTGTIAARRASLLAFEGSGLVIAMQVDEGERVEAGQVLAQLDTSILDAQRDQILSQKDRLQARLDELLAGPRAEVVSAARAEAAAIDKQLELAILQRDRRKALVESGTIGVEQLDTLETQAQTLTSRLAAARARLSELENGTRSETIAAQRGAVAEADAGLRAIGIRIAKATLRAPFDGVVAKRLLDEGAVVSEQMPAAAFEVVEAGVLEARIGVPAASARDIAESISDQRSAAPSSEGSEAQDREAQDREAQDREARTQNGEAQSRDALDEPAVWLRDQRVTIHRVRRLPSLDPSTRTVTLVLELDPKSASAAQASPGDIVALRRTVEREERGAWIPLAALRESSRGLWSAYAVHPAEDRAGHKTDRIELEILHVNGDRAFVRGTFDGPTTVATTGAHRLVPGQFVQPIRQQPIREQHAPADRAVDAAVDR